MGENLTLVTTATEPTTPTSRRASADAVLADAVELARAAAVELAGAAARSASTSVPTPRASGWSPTTSPASTRPTAAGAGPSPSPGRPAARRSPSTRRCCCPAPTRCSARRGCPWCERLKPGDLGVGDLLLTEEDDDRLEPGYAGAVALGERVDEVADEIDRVALWELGLGRARVLSPIGRDDAIDRWYSGDHGPTAPIAEAAPAPCSTCGFFLPLAGSLRRVFGVCANEFSPGDGTVVSVDHGCGAHSEVAVLPGPIEVTPPVLDEMDYDVITLHPVEHAAGLGRRRGATRGSRPLLSGTDGPIDPTDPFGTAALRARVLAAWAASPAAVPRGRQRRGGPRPRQLPRPGRRRARPERRRRRRPRRRAGPAACSG